MIQPIDWSKVPVDPDPNFDPEHNARVIQETIEENDRLRIKRQREFGSKLKEKSEAVSRYLKDLADGKTSSSTEKYFGVKELVRLRGEEIRDIIRAKIGDATKKKAIEKARNTKAVT